MTADVCFDWLLIENGLLINENLKTYVTVIIKFNSKKLLIPKKVTIAMGGVAAGEEVNTFFRTQLIVMNYDLYLRYMRF